MAPTTTIETVTVARPIKVMALICGCCALLLLVIGIASTAWLEAEDYRQGLWEECFKDENEIQTCQKNEYTDWIIACASLCILGLLISLAGTVLTGVGIISKTPSTKKMLYIVAMITMFLSAVLVVISLIVFPCMFMQEINERGKPEWYFGWAYGVVWGAAIFLVGAGILLLMDKETDEIYYREKTYGYEAQS